ncbi:16S rRNA (adenine(1518)-N(6)/adenine(1519)-N(6))-dimethyltransferase RsmA [Nesterenkonia alkaliphila]|uniref:Ribosomal RNA small subunit methyltransferase A n=1 Tax=Nesterenkonia alkaliphila TaxID=1463631 RepID=A0A7K1UM14_9MICC|nr:16S rRNA (adenine(1518)-N(6)/adenine(1519)-N(6))-dimethyltransferase RsmA [Nesterenkonia alkaliphila]MVT27507.1 16S rRNA (adenine(1518)-N(6)/adenine(1519)-N(6))-dimethyltransferase RsmA [Nesterenkonia alkaliphila]GFZ94776.1 ribosomal RNA small subunit methyltransferase A [Nesterenkonia alkaliphila]
MSSESAASRQLPELLTAAHIRDLAEALSIRPTKQWGQNFVIDPNTIRRIVGLAELDGSEHVLEVGPGLGSLTLGLLDEAARVTAVEVDPKLAAQLPETVKQLRPQKLQDLTVLRQDALKIQAGELNEPSVLVANLPYNVAVPVVLHLLQVLPSLTKGLVMVQEEVADRLAAAPGSKIYGVPSVKLAWDTSTRKVGVVGKKVFWPEPRISSGLVRFDRGEPAASSVSRQEVFAVIDAAFAQRRKTLRAALSGLAGSGTAAEQALRAAGIDPQARGETLDVHAFARIAAALAQTG